MSDVSRRGLVLALGLALTVPFLCAPAKPVWAGPPSEQLRLQIDRVIKTLDDPDLKKDGRQKERRHAVRKIADEIFDFSETAKRSLGRHWAQRTPSERQEFVQLFSDLLERSYLSKIELYGGEKVAYLGDTVEGEQATVKTKIVTKQGTEIPVDYRMMRVGPRWMVYDVYIEGVSLIGNYRTQFNKIIQTSSYADLLKKMRTKQEELMDEANKTRKS